MSRSVRELLPEFLVIVVGVFIALAAESWWSEREERQFERELREDMVAEFEANLDILETDIARNEEARKRIGLLGPLSDEDLFALADATLIEEFGPYLLWAGFDPAMGSVQALVESGNITAVGERELRLLLARWAGLLEQNRRFNLQAVNFQHREVTPVIARAGSDATWSQAERRELRALLEQFQALFEIAVENQYELRQAARDILDFLDDAE